MLAKSNSNFLYLLMGPKAAWSSYVAEVELILSNIFSNMKLI